MLLSLPKRPTRHFPNHPLTSLECGALLKSLTNTKSLSQGQQLHAQMLTCNTLESNTYLYTKLAAFYANCGQLTQAQHIFDHIVLKNSFLWNSMIKGYACSSNNFAIKAIDLYREMHCFGVKPDNFTYPFVLKACGDISLVEIGRRVQSDVVVNGLESDVYVSNSLLNMYSKLGYIETVKKVFDRMLERDLVSWNTMLVAYVKNGDPVNALLFFREMCNAGVVPDCTTLIGLLSACTDLGAIREGRIIHGYVIRSGFFGSDILLSNSLIEMYCCCNCMVDGRKFFDEVKRKDTVSWNIIISGYSMNADAFESLRLFCQMVAEGVWCDRVTIVTVLGACDQITALHFGLSMHSYVLKKGFGAYSMVGTALMDMYSKCGSLSCSRGIFDDMPEKSLVSWSAMIAGYGFHGKGMDAVHVFQELKASGVVLDEGVFASVLSACSHAGLVNKGKEIFQSMRDHNIKPAMAHYSCLVDLLGRAGHLDEAFELVTKMEIEPSNDIWSTLISACQLHQNVELADLAAQKLFEMNPKGIGSYICLSNLYAVAKRWDDVERVRAMARRKGLRKEPGCSFVELDKVVHRFLVGDKSHQQTVEIYAKLEELQAWLKEVGYKPDTSSVFYDVEESVKEKMLWDHSERLAIAFALIKTSPGTTIRITKNLRTCRDCHTVTKHISKLTSREIIMRDTRRYHHFKDGVCSCGDYW